MSRWTLQIGRTALTAALLLASTAQGGDVPRKAVEPLPESRGGQEVIGTKLPELAFDRWLPEPVADKRKPANEPTPAAEAKPMATLYRWWTDGCPYCERSLPAIEKLRQKYAGRGLRVVAAYHPKPVRKVDDAHIREASTRIGYGGTVAVDEDWSELKRAYLERSKTARATSVTMLVNAAGVVEWVHPGPEFFQSDEPDEAQADSDFRSLEKAVSALLEETE